MKKYLLTALPYVLLIIVIAFFVKCNSSTKATIKRLNSNLTTLSTANESFRLKDSSYVVQTQQLQLTTHEFKTLYNQKCEELKQLNIKVKYLQQYSSAGIVNTYPIHDTIFDSLIITNNIIDTIKCIDYFNPYIAIKGCITNNAFNGTILTTDTIKQVVERVPKRFLFIKYGTKYLKQSIISSSPYSIIAFDTAISLK